MSIVTPQGLDFNVKEPIPGYITTELIGRGGSGEVWKAIAPGGLPKAVKIVYGDLIAERAAVELKALARIKDVRHALLLSIERIETAGPNLIIVTELADCSLKDYFLTKKKAGSVGVEQSELSRYLSDAAEALDFLYAQYSLQHLDVKPENILLLAGRAKVGDFGLVKNLYERANSIVGGLTPTYSPPELFDGKPTHYSDQYSLAIVYMQMLTGSLPFSGTNPAQLAAQHLQGVPELSALPRHQRPVIARALSKNPSQRFESCTAMMQALLASVDKSTEARSASSPSRPLASVSGRSPVQSTESSGALHEPKAQEGCWRSPAIGGQSSARAPAQAKREGDTGETAGERVVEGQSCRSTPPARSSRQDSQLQPIVIVGVGGTALQVVGKFVNRLQDRIGDARQSLPLQVVLIDSDVGSLTAPASSDGRSVQLVPIRLRCAETFGSRSAEILRWLNRRWFYGIPRDLTTGHYRPLGRLALLTHAARVREALRSAVSAAADCLHDETQDQSDERRYIGAPRVLVVGSISGATGGGALIDVAYALRNELKRLGIPDDEVHGLLLHSTPRGNADRDKALANAYATLTELHHYSRRGSHFPGEASLGVPSFHGDNATFGRTYLMNLGSGLSEREWDVATERAAEFLYCSTLTPAKLHFDDWQQSDNQNSSRPESPNSVWCCDVLAFGAGTTRMISQIARRICVDVVQLWREGREAGAEGAGGASRTALMAAFASHTPSRSARIDSAVKQKLTECNLVVEQLLKEAAEVVQLEAGNEDEYVRGLVDEALAVESERCDTASNRVDRLVTAIDGILCCDADDDPTESSRGSLYQRIVARLVVRGSRQAGRLLEWIKEMVDTPTVRVEGARLYATSAKRLLRETHERLKMQAAELRGRARALAVEAWSASGECRESSRLAEWLRRKLDPLEPLRQALRLFAGMRLKEALNLAVAKQLALIETDLTTLINQLDNLSRNLALLKERLQDAGERPIDGEESHSLADVAAARYEQLIVEQLNERRHDIACGVAEAIDRHFFRGNPGVRRFLELDAELWTTLGPPLSEASRSAVVDCLKSILCRLVQDSVADSAANGGELLNVIVEGLAATAPPPQTGPADQLLIVPADIDAAGLRQRLDAVAPNLAIIAASTCDLALCTVRRDVPLDQFAEELIGGVAILKELAGRLHTRIDVQWLPLQEKPERLAMAAETESLSATPTAIIALPRRPLDETGTF